MKAKILSVLILGILLAAQQASACPFCYGAKDGKSTQHMAVAIWFLFGAVLSVIGGIRGFSLHVWGHGRMPVEPHQAVIGAGLRKDELPSAGQGVAGNAGQQPVRPRLAARSYP